MDYKSLKSQLEERIAKIPLKEIVKNELSKNKRFSLYEVDNESLIFFNHREEGQSKLHIGFPFPLYSENYFSVLNDLKIDAFIRGEPVRKMQREDIKKISSIYKEMEYNFLAFTKTIIGNPERLVYIDPYNFIGDSFIGLYFLDSFKELFKTKKEIIFSMQSDHLQSTINTKDYPIERVGEEVKDGDLIIMPDLIDTNWKKSIQTINEIIGKKIKIVIPGRNLFLDVGTYVKTYHFNTEDILLRNKNIEDYMSDCLTPFGVKGVAISGEKKFHNTSRFFFNSFASQEIRYIQPELMFQVYKNIKERDKKAEFYLIGGYHKNESHTNWLNNFLTMLKEDGSMRRISINYYSNLTELLEHMEERECSEIFTADTSIAHVANRHGYANITIYNPKAWDVDSIQSISSSSPAGFCRYFPLQMPLINKGSSVSKIKHTALIASESLLFFQKSLEEQKTLYKQRNLEWIKEMYNPIDIISNIQSNEKGKFLIESAHKISPQYKLKNLLK